MSEQPTAHADIAGYVLGRLPDDERERFLAHLETCSECQRELAGLTETTKLLAQAGPAVEPPHDLARRSFDRVAALAAAERMPPRSTAPSPGWRRWLSPPRLAAALALTGVVALSVLAGTQIEGDDGAVGVLEIDGALQGTDGGEASISVRQLAIGREITLTSDDLPILPKGELYELWFVAPDDRPHDPNRISAGTFHPDENGRSDVSLTAAVDPARYPVLSVTAEPGDGDPAPSGEEVMRLDARDQLDR